MILNINGNEIEFTGRQELLEWLVNERNAWAWLPNHPQGQNSWNILSAAINDFDYQINRLAQQGQAIGGFLQTIADRFNDQLVYSRSIEGELIQQIAASEGVEAGASAYAFYRKNMSLGDVRTAKSLKGIVAFAFPAAAPVDQILKELVAERTQMRRTGTELKSRADAAELQRDAAVRIAYRKGARRYLANLKGMLSREATVENQRRDGLENYEVTAKASFARIDALEATYREKIGLLAPVEYWKKKAQKHKDARKWLLVLTIAYFVITLAGLGSLFFNAGYYLIHHKLENNAALFVAGAGLATLSGVLLWAGRLITRLYLSEHHLAHDSEERAVMTETYLALTGEKAATDAERAIILTALFRNTSDGVVRDDAAPDVSMGGLIARLAGGKA